MLLLNKSGGLVVSKMLANVVTCLETEESRQGKHHTFSIGGKIVTIQQMSESVILVSKQVPICYCVNASLAHILSSINKLTGNGTFTQF